ncbi:uncharacterized protein [Diadema setosum]|uniref:uncharacterized protein n=1 Tax=Diadema setosum TaxID=31175 RepID=UPI003B3BC219
MVFGTKNYGAIASAYGPLTRLMPKTKETGIVGQQDVDQQRQQKQKHISSSLLEFTKRMDKIKQARIAISKSREQGRLSARPKRQTRKAVLPGVSELENEALTLTRTFISQAQWRSANSIANNLVEKNKEALKRQGIIKSNIFSHELQKLSDDTSPSSFCRYWKVVGGDGEVKHIPVFKATDTIVYSSVSRPAPINKPQEATDKSEKKVGDSSTEVITVDEAGNTQTHLTRQSFQKYHPGILPKPGTKGPYKSKVTLHVSLPQVETDFLNHDDDYDDQDNDTESCSIDLPKSSESSGSTYLDDAPTQTNINQGGISNETQASKYKFEAAIKSGNQEAVKEKDEIEEKKDEGDREGDKDKKGVKEKVVKTEKKEIHGVKSSSKSVIEPKKKDSVPSNTLKDKKINLQYDVTRVVGGGPRSPTAGSIRRIVRGSDNSAPQTQKSILKRDSKPLPDIPTNSQPGNVTVKARRASLQQIHIPGGVVKLGKVTYHRSYKINVKPQPSNGKDFEESGKARVTLHDSFVDAVKRTNVIKEAERTLRLDKNSRETQERRKKFNEENPKALWQSLCRHGRFINECYTCRAVEEIRVRLQNSHTKSQQQYQWNLLSKHENQITKSQALGANLAKHHPVQKGKPYRLSTVTDLSDANDLPQDTAKPLGLPGGRVATDKEAGRENPQGFGPSQPTSKQSSEAAENASSKRVRFAEARIYDPMRGAYREQSREEGTGVVAKT